MESQYLYDKGFQIEPKYYDNGVPVFYPTYHEFQDFYKFNKAINKYGMQSGIVKIIPPKEWLEEVQQCYTEENLSNVLIQNPIVQNMNVTAPGMSKKYQPPRKNKRNRDDDNGDNEKKDVAQNENTFTVVSEPSFYNIDTSEFTDERCTDLEKTYWKSLTYSEPMYGADTLGSIFKDKIKSWNVAHLPNLLDLMDVKLPGVNEAYLYAGLWKATFAWHLEDQDLYSINFLHFGAPKQWYSIPQAQHQQFYQLMRDMFTDECKHCSEFLRHKTFMMSPLQLEKHGIQVNHTIHREGEFIITYPYGYHAGFNYGYNLAESVNFALDDWFEFGKTTKKCECISDSVGIDIKQLWEKFYGKAYKDIKDESSSEDNVGSDEINTPRKRKSKPTEKLLALKSPKVVQKKQPTSSLDSPSPRKTKKRIPLDSKSPNKPTKVSPVKLKHQPDPDLGDSDESIKIAQVVKRSPAKRRKLEEVEITPKPKTKLSEPDYECFLCPNNLAHTTYAKSPLFELLDTDIHPLKIHRLCANMFPKQLVLNTQTNIVEGLSSISKQQMKLKCTKCKQQNIGACFQCTYKKCTRSYHGSCGITDGVLHSFDTEDTLCKYHRNPSQSLPLKVGSFVQFSFNGGLYCGNVISLNDKDVEVTVYPFDNEILEIPVTNIINQTECFVNMEKFNYMATK
ncbi:RPH1 DNA damage-responsive transcriptional repressor RPH1 [Candida maltosa Xu316]